MKNPTLTKPGDPRDKNFGLSEKEFEQLVHQLREGDYKLYERMFLKHFQSCVDYVMFRCKADYTTAYDSSMDAMLDMCRRIKLGRLQYGNLRFLFTRIACQYYNGRKKKGLQIEELKDIEIADPNNRASDELLDLLEASLNQIDRQCQELLKKFYFHKQPLKAIAAKVGKTEVALRKQKQRCLAGLRSLFMKRHNA